MLTVYQHYGLVHPCKGDKSGGHMGLDLGKSPCRGPPGGIAHAPSVLWELLKEIRALLCIIMFH